MKRKIELTEEEIKALLDLVDAGVRQIGIGAAQAAGYFLHVLQNAPEASPVEPPKDSGGFVPAE